MKTRIKNVTKSTEEMSKRKFHSHLLWIVQPLLLFVLCLRHFLSLPILHSNSIHFYSLHSIFFQPLALFPSHPIPSQSICSYLVSARVRSPSKLIIRHRFLCGCVEYDFSSIVLPFLFSISLYLFLFILVLIHCALHRRFDDIFSIWSFPCTTLNQETVSIRRVHFFRDSLLYGHIFCHHFSFVQSSFLYYIEFSVNAFVLFNLKSEKKNSRKTREKWIYSIWFFYHVAKNCH